MKAGEYISLFGFLHTYPIYWRNGHLHEYIDDNPDVELNDDDLQTLYIAEMGSLANALKNFKIEGELISFLRELFDDYRADGGDPEYWLCLLLEQAESNPHTYPAGQRGAIEETLLQWLGNYRTTHKAGRESVNGSNDETTVKNPRENHHVKALYLFYTGQSVTREGVGNSVFNKWSDWRDKKKRTTPGAIVGTGTKKKHLKTVLEWLVSEEKRHNAAQCQQDIDTLNANYAKS